MQNHMPFCALEKFAIRELLCRESPATAQQSQRQHQIPTSNDNVSAEAADVAAPLQLPLTDGQLASPIQNSRLHSF